MRTLTSIAAALAVAAILAPGPVSADLQQIVATRDATIFEENIVGANGKGHLFAGNNADGDARRALLIFDVSGIPSGSVVDSAYVTLECTKGLSGTHPFSLHRMTKSWTEGPSTGTGRGGGIPSALTWLDVTWYYASFTAAANDTFLTQGGDFIGAASATTAVGPDGSYGWSDSQLIADVQAWVASPASNYGWILVGDEINTANARRFDSREDTILPTLTVIFSPPTPVEAATWGKVKALYQPE